MRKLVVALVVLLALFTFIRDFPAAVEKAAVGAGAQASSALIP